MLDAVFAPLPEQAGRVGLLSSDEFLDRALPFDEALLADAGVERIAVVLCADHAAAPQSAGFARKHFHRFGIEVIDTGASCTIGPLPQADLLYFGGGNSRELAQCVRAREGWWDEVLDRWRGGMHLAGSSAGAMILGEYALGTCPCANPHHEWGDALGPLTGVGFVVHADRHDSAWLAAIPEHAPGPVVAIDEGTGILLHAGSPPRIVGEGEARVLGR